MPGQQRQHKLQGTVSIASLPSESLNSQAALLRSLSTYHNKQPAPMTDPAVALDTVAKPVLHQHNVCGRGNQLSLCPYMGGDPK
jgi:hypothetical protein